MPPPAAPGRSDATAPGSIIVNNAEGEVHFHFHGTAPTVVEPVRAPRLAAAPQVDPPPAPTRASGKVVLPPEVIEFTDVPAPPKPAAKKSNKAEKAVEKGKEPEPKKEIEKKEPERKINEDAEQSLVAFVRVMWGSF